LPQARHLDVLGRRYERLYYGEEGIAPSLLDISSDEDR
jgi:hypothetical protein